MARTPGAAADRVATEVQERIERLATLAADAILHSLYAPQVVSPPLEQSLDYWEPFFFTPDGRVNQPGRDQVLKQLGGAEYKKVAYDLARRIRREGRAAEAETPGTPAGQPANGRPSPGAAPPLGTANGRPSPGAPPTAPEPPMPPLYGPRTAPA